MTVLELNHALNPLTVNIRQAAGRCCRSNRRIAFAVRRLVRSWLTSLQMGTRRLGEGNSDNSEFQFKKKSMINNDNYLIIHVSCGGGLPCHIPAIKSLNHVGN